MIKRVSIHKLPKEGDPDEIWKWGIEQHAAIAKTYPGLRKYVVNKVVKVIKDSDQLEFWWMGEMWWDTEEDMIRALKSPQAQRESPLFWAKLPDRFSALVEEVEIC